MALREGNSALDWVATRPEDSTPPTAVAVGHFVQVPFPEGAGLFICGTCRISETPFCRAIFRVAIRELARMCFTLRRQAGVISGQLSTAGSYRNGHGARYCSEMTTLG